MRGQTGRRILTAIIGVWVAVGLRSSGAPATPAPSQEAKTPKPTRSVWDGVYTEEQARRGRRTFQSRCADCHKASEFKEGYQTADDIFSSRSVMPESAPGSLSAQDYADLIAYILEVNDLPAGKEELKGDPALLRQIRIEAEKPPGR